MIPSIFASAAHLFDATTDQYGPLRRVLEFRWLIDGHGTCSRFPLLCLFISTTYYQIYAVLLWHDLTLTILATFSHARTLFPTYTTQKRRQSNRARNGRFIFLIPHHFMFISCVTFLFQSLAWLPGCCAFF